MSNFIHSLVRVNIILAVLILFIMLLLKICCNSSDVKVTKAEIKVRNSVIFLTAILFISNIAIAFMSSALEDLEFMFIHDLYAGICLANICYSFGKKRKRIIMPIIKTAQDNVIACLLKAFELEDLDYCEQLITLYSRLESFEFRVNYGTVKYAYVKSKISGYMEELKIVEEAIDTELSEAENENE